MAVRRPTTRYGPGGAIAISVDSSELQEFYRGTLRFRPRLRAELHDQFGDAAERVAEQARRNVLASRFPATRPARRPHPARRTGLRTELAAATQVQVRRAGDGVEARVLNRHRMAAPTDGRWGNTWRHPTYGRTGRGQWVAQRASHWFRRARADAGPAGREAALASMRSALAEVRSRRGVGRALARLRGR